MRLFKRLRNLWRLSELEMPKENKETTIKDMIKKRFDKHAIIVSMNDPIKSLDLGE